MEPSKQDLLRNLEELAEEWEEVASWGDRDEMSRYERGLKDDGKDKARELRELIEKHD